jgi:hypothetical protein
VPNEVWVYWDTTIGKNVSDNPCSDLVGDRLRVDTEAIKGQTRLGNASNECICSGVESILVNISRLLEPKFCLYIDVITMSNLRPNVAVACKEVRAPIGRQAAYCLNLLRCEAYLFAIAATVTAYCSEISHLYCGTFQRRMRSRAAVTLSRQLSMLLREKNMKNAMSSCSK